MVAGRDLFAIRDEAVQKGWHCNNAQWRCSRCYSKWEASEIIRRTTRADIRKETANA